MGGEADVPMGQYVPGEDGDSRARDNIRCHPRRLSGLDVSSDTYSKDFTVPFSDSLENNGEVNDKIHTSLCLLHRSVFSLSLRKFYICCVT